MACAEAIAIKQEKATVALNETMEAIEDRMARLDGDRERGLSALVRIESKLDDVLRALADPAVVATLQKTPAPTAPTPAPPVRPKAK